jgi:hypothetical protein
VRIYGQKEEIETQARAAEERHPAPDASSPIRATVHQVET